MSLQLSNCYLDSGSQNNIDNTGKFHKKEPVRVIKAQRMNVQKNIIVIRIKVQMDN